MISLFLIGISGLSYLGYRRWSQNRAMASGDVFFDPNDRSAAPPTAPPVPAQPAQPIVYPPAQSGDATPATSPQGPLAAQGKTLAPSQRPSVAPAHPVPDQTTAGSAADSLSPNPPNGMVFAGTGRFQVYRQGNLTWRIDTNTGKSCVLFATNEEWRKPQVYRHGCNSSAAH
jgi:hypothetical protein